MFQLQNDQETDHQDLALLYEAVKYRWDINQRPKQTLPTKPFFLWMILAGRGFGKTRTGAETVREWVKTAAYVNLIGATADDARDILIEGESGILAICPKDERPLYVPSKRRLEWPNGAKSLIFTADEPERLRGKQHMKLWMDELASWRYLEAYDQAMFGLRLGDNPQAVITTTPTPTQLILDIIEDKRNIITYGTTYENKDNLAKGFFDYVITKYEGTRLGRQELNAELLMDMPGALWSRTDIDNARVYKPYQALEVIVVAVDPSASSTGDEAGIITAGSLHGEYYTLCDSSMQGSPNAWAKQAVTDFHKFKANYLIAEKNNGGEMVRQVIHEVDPTVPVKLVHASRGKKTRAEPVSTLSELGKDHHVGSFPKLEDELCLWLPGDPSPNRLDAKVWAITALMGKLQNKKAKSRQG